MGQQRNNKTAKQGQPPPSGLSSSPLSMRTTFSCRALCLASFRSPSQSADLAFDLSFLSALLLFVIHLSHTSSSPHACNPSSRTEKRSLRVSSSSPLCLLCICKSDPRSVRSSKAKRHATMLSGCNSRKEEALLTRNKRKDHPVEVVEEADEVEAELVEAFLLMLRQCPKDFCRIKHVIFVHDSTRDDTTLGVSSSSRS